MSLSTALPGYAIEASIRLLMPQFAPLIDDAQERQALILRSLGDYRAETLQELAGAVEIISLQMKRMSLLAQSSDPELEAQKADQYLRRVCSLSRCGQLAQRSLEARQRERQQPA